MVGQTGGWVELQLIPLYWTQQGKTPDVQPKLGRCIKAAHGHIWHFVGICLIHQAIVLMLPFLGRKPDPFFDPCPKLQGPALAAGPRQVAWLVEMTGKKERAVNEITTWRAHRRRDGTVHRTSHWMLGDLGNVSNFTAAKAQLSGWDKWATHSYCFYLPHKDTTSFGINWKLQAIIKALNCI